MDNQQVTDFEMGWLSGIIDGEGSFTMSPGSKGSYNVGIKIVNTDLEIVDKIVEILRKMNVAFHVYDSWRAANQRAGKRIEINGVKRVKSFLDIFMPYMMAKKYQAEILLKYVTIRLETPYGEMCPAFSQATYSNLRDCKRPQS